MDKKNGDSHLEREQENTSQEVDRLRRRVHNLEEQLRYHKKTAEKKRKAELQAQVRAFRNGYRNIGRVYYVWLVVDRKNLEEAERIKVQEVSRLLETEVQGGEDKLGSLAEKLNQTFDGVLEHLKSDIPDMGPADYNLFCYLAAGFDKYLIIELLGLSGSELYYTRKSRLKEKLRHVHSPYQLTYLALINK